MASSRLDGRDRRLHFRMMVVAMPALCALGVFLAFGGVLSGPHQLLALALPAYALGVLPAAAIAMVHDRLTNGHRGGAGTLFACSVLAGAFPGIILAALYAAGLIHGTWPLAVLPVTAASAALSVLLADLFVRAMKRPAQKL